MNKDYYIKLTLAVYRVTDLFPKEEPLRFKIRQKSLDILTGLISINPHLSTKNLLIDIAIIKSLFGLAETQNWVDSRNFLVLKREYDKIGKELGKDSPRTFFRKFQSKKKKTFKKLFYKPNQRHKKILEILKEKRKAQVWELKKIFPEITKRTLRRDVERLLKKGLIERKGEKNNTYYQVVG